MNARTMRRTVLSLVLVTGYPALASNSVVETFTFNSGNPTSGPWAPKVAVGATMGVSAGPLTAGVSMSTTIWTRTVTQNKIDVTVTSKYTSAWGAFWSNSGALAGNRIVSTSSTPRVATMNQVGFGITAPTDPKPNFDDYSTNFSNIMKLVDRAGNALYWDSSLVPTSTLDAYASSLSIRYGRAAPAFADASAVLQSPIFLDPAAPLISAVFLSISNDFSTLSSQWAASHATWPDTAYDPLIAHLTALRALIPQGMSTSGIIDNGLRNVIGDFQTMSSLLAGGLSSSETGDFAQANEASGSALMELGLATGQSKVPAPSTLVVAVGALPLMTRRRRAA